MVKLKEIPRTAAFAWSPSVSDPLIASGTVAGAIDADFSATTQLELWSLSLLDRSSDGFQLKPTVSIDTDARFYDIAWGAVSESNPQGLIAGALESGDLQLWKPHSVLAGESAPFLKSKKHGGAIKSIQFNPSQPKVLASGGSKGEIFVWDLTKLDSPSSPGTPSSRHDEIESVSWNNSVSHILATGGNTGFTSVWDLRNRREVLHLHYTSQGASGRHPVSSVQWHPNNSTKLMTASEDDNCPVILLWDLRNANAPERVLSGHTGGVLSIDWCKQDSSLLLSSGKDNRTLLWNTDTGDQLGEYPIATNWAFETRFNPKIPDIIASASFDGKISVQSLQDVDNTEHQKEEQKSNEDFWNPSSYVDTLHATFKKQQAPAWLKPPVAAHFGFGGKIVAVKTVDGKSTVSISKFVGDESISEDTSKFATALKSNNISEIIDYRKTDTADEFDWQLLSIFSDKTDLNKKLAEFIGVEESDAANGVDDADKAGAGLASESNDFPVSADDGADLFSKLSLNSEEAFAPSGEFSLFSESQSKNEQEISRAVLQGDINKAVEIALKEDLLSDAFLLALNSDDAARKKVQNAFVKKYYKEKPYVRLLNSIQCGDLNDFVENTAISEWRNVFTALFSYCKDASTFSKFATRIGDRILQNKASISDARDNALFCYAAGNSLEKVSAIWLQEIDDSEKKLIKENTTPFNAHVKALHRFIEKVTVYRQLSGTNLDASGNLEQLYDAYRDYANIIASQGDLGLAEKFLDLLPSEHPGVSLEKERVVKASNSKPSKVATGYGNTTANRYGLPSSTSGVSSPAKPKTARVPYVASVSAGAAPPAAGTSSATPAYAPKTASTTTSSIYAPAQLSGQSGIPAASPISNTFASAQPSSNPYAPAVSNPYAPSSNPYQPVGTPKPAASTPLAPPPSGKAGGVTPPPPPTGSAKPKSTSGWNDLPAAALAANSSVRRPPSSSQTVVSPFPGSGQGPSPIASPGLSGQHSRVIPPPPTSVGPPPRSARASPSIGGAAIPAAPPSNPYAAVPVPQPPQAPVNQFAPAPAPAQAERVLSPVNPYAPSGASFSATPPVVGSNSYAPPPGAAAPGAGPITPQIPHAPPATVAAASVAQSPPPAPKPPTPPPAAPKYPPGDRSHISQSALPIYEILSQEIARVKPAIPANFKRQVIDCERRLNILFDHLNNDDLLAPDTVSDMVELSTAIVNKDYDQANMLHLDILTGRSEQCGQWMVGVKRLIEMSRAL